MADPTVLVVEHEAGAPAAWLGERLEARGVALRVLRPYAGDPVPEELPGVDGLLVLGGSMDSWDDQATGWLAPTRSLVRQAEARGVPTLGICLGHQLAALALGGEVGRSPAGRTVAVVPLLWSPEAGDDELFAPLAGARHAVHWNSDVVLRLPPGGVVTAVSADGQVQAARLGVHVWGVQFHPEASPAVLAGWVEELGTMTPAEAADMAAYLAAAEAVVDDLRATCDRLAEGFAGVVARRPRTP